MKRLPAVTAVKLFIVVMPQTMNTAESSGIAGIAVTPYTIPEFRDVGELDVAVPEIVPSGQGRE